jgi:taurine--2-oxoglutarate transaminase
MHSDVRTEYARRLVDVAPEPPAMGQTFAGNPIGCACGIAALKQYDVVGDVRGRGFLWCADFIDPDTGDPIFDPRLEDDENPVDGVVGETRERGVSVGSGRPGFQVMVAPPLCASEEEITEGVEVLNSSIKSVFG